MHDALEPPARARRLTEGAQEPPPILVDPCFVLSGGGLATTMRVMAVPPIELDVRLTRRGEVLLVDGDAATPHLEENLGSGWRDVLTIALRRKLVGDVSVLLDTRGAADGTAGSPSPCDASVGGVFRFHLPIGASRTTVVALAAHYFGSEAASLLEAADGP